jgi:type IV pilus assembly protein PilM
MSILSSLFSKQKGSLGIDIGTTSIKAVELTKGSVNPYLVNYGILESYGHYQRENNVIQANSLKISEKDAIEMLKILMSKSKFQTNDVVASIPSFSSFTTLVEMPEMSKQDTLKAMSFQISQNIPLPLSEITVDWMRVGQREDENGFVKQQIFLVAIPNETISRFKNIFKGAGLNLRALEIETFAYSRAIMGQEQSPTIIIDFGARSVNFTVVDQSFVKYNVQFDSGGDALTSSIAKGLRISNKRAEELKKQRGILESSSEFELSTLQGPFIDVIIKEAEKVVDKSEHDFGIKIQKAVIIGGGANLLGIDRYFEDHMKIKTEIGNGLAYIEFPQQLSVVSKELGTRFASAIGLAMKNFIGTK